MVGAFKEQDVQEFSIAHHLVPLYIYHRVSKISCYACQKKGSAAQSSGDQLYARDKYCTSVSKAVYYWPQVDLILLSGILKNNFDIFVIDAIVEKFDEDKCRN